MAFLSRNLITLLLVALKLSLLSSAVMERNWIQNEANLNYYRLFTNPLPFEMARRSCEPSQSHLASIDSLEEQKFVMKNMIASDNSYWIQYHNSDCYLITNESLQVVDCSVSLPYICEIESSSSNQVREEDESVLENEDKVISNTTRNQDPNITSETEQTPLTTLEPATFTEIEEDNRPLIMTVAIPSGGVILALIVIIVIVVVTRRKRLASQKLRDSSSVEEGFEMKKIDSSSRTSSSSSMTSDSQQGLVKPEVATSNDRVVVENDNSIVIKSEDVAADASDSSSGSSSSGDDEDDSESSFQSDDDTSSESDKD